MVVGLPASVAADVEDAVCTLTWLRGVPPPLPSWGLLLPRGNLRGLSCILRMEAADASVVTTATATPASAASELPMGRWMKRLMPSVYLFLL